MKSNMTRLASISFALTRVLALVTATVPLAANQNAVAGPSTSEPSVSDLTAQVSLTMGTQDVSSLQTTTNPTASLSFNDQGISAGVSLNGQSHEYETGTEVETWAFCTAAWLVPFGWIGLCPDRFDFRHAMTRSRIRTVTSTLFPSRRSTAPQSGPPAAISTSTKLVTSTTTQTQFKTNTKTSTTTSTTTSTIMAIRTNVETSIKTIEVIKTPTTSVTVSIVSEAESQDVSTVTETKTKTSTIHEPTTITHTEEAIIPEDLTRTTITSTSTASWTTTRLTQATVTLTLYEDGPAPDNTNCFGGSFFPPIKRKGCENFYALHRADQLIIWFTHITVVLLTFYIIDLGHYRLSPSFARLFGNIKGEPYKNPMDDSSDSGSASPDSSSPPDGGDGPSPLLNDPRDGSASSSSSGTFQSAKDGKDQQVAMQPVSERDMVFQIREDVLAESGLAALYSYIVDNQVCEPHDPTILTWMLLRLSEEVENGAATEEDYKNAREFLFARYPDLEYANSDVRKLHTLPLYKPGDLQPTGPQNLYHVQDKIIDWANNYPKTKHVDEIRGFVDLHLNPKDITDDPDYIIRAVDHLTGQRSGYGYNSNDLPTWRVHLEAALVARTQEHETGQPWTPQFDGLEDLLAIHDKRFTAYEAMIAAKLQSRKKMLATTQLTSTAEGSMPHAAGLKGDATTDTVETAAAGSEDDSIVSNQHDISELTEDEGLYGPDTQQDTQSLVGLTSAAPIEELIKPPSPPSNLMELLSTPVAPLPFSRYGEDDKDITTLTGPLTLKPTTKKQVTSLTSIAASSGAPPQSRSTSVSRLLTEIPPSPTKIEGTAGALILPENETENVTQTKTEPREQPGFIRSEPDDTDELQSPASKPHQSTIGPRKPQKIKRRSNPMMNRLSTVKEETGESILHRTL